MEIHGDSISDAKPSLIPKLQYPKLVVIACSRAEKYVVPPVIYSFVGLVPAVKLYIQ